MSREDFSAKKVSESKKTLFSNFWGLRGYAIGFTSFLQVDFCPSGTGIFPTVRRTRIELVAECCRPSTVAAALPLKNHEGSSSMSDGPFDEIDEFGWDR